MKLLSFLTRIHITYHNIVEEDCANSSLSNVLWGQKNTSYNKKHCLIPTVRPAVCPFVVRKPRFLNLSTVILLLWQLSTLRSPAKDAFYSNSNMSLRCTATQNIIEKTVTFLVLLYILYCVSSVQKSFQMRTKYIFRLKQNDVLMNARAHRTRWHRNSWLIMIEG